MLFNHDFGIDGLVGFHAEQVTTGVHQHPVRYILAGLVGSGKLNKDIDCLARGNPDGQVCLGWEIANRHHG